MNRKVFIMLLVSAFLVGTVSAALAALTTTSHNIPLHQGYSDATALQGPCSFCHTPHGAAGDKLFPTSVIIGGGVSSQWVNDGITKICWSCHGASVVYANPQNVMPFQNVGNAAHGRDISELSTWGDISVPTNLANIYGYSDSASRAAVDGGQYAISCASCHNPHDNTYRPFLRNNTVTGDIDIVVGNFLSLCDDCHQNRAINGNGGTRVNHPTDTLLAENTGNANLYVYSAIAVANSVFDSAWSDMTIENTQIDGTGAWNLGGKFKYEATMTGIINCGTCHMVHSNEVDAANYATDDGIDNNVEVTGIVDWTYNGLLVRSEIPTTDTAAPICTSCHDISDTAAGPGALTTYSHAYQSSGWDVPAGSGIIDPAIVSVSPYFAKFGGGAGPTRTIVCQSCHDMHFARLDDTANVKYAMMRVNCSECHAATADDHHPYDVAVTYGTDLRDDGASGPPLLGSGVAWDTIGSTAIALDPNTYTSGTYWTELDGTTAYIFENDTGTSGTMTCATCHNDGAHNGRVAGMLAGEAVENTMCVDCHGFNPGYFTGWNGTDVAGTASHWVGPISTTAYRWGGNAASAADSIIPAAGDAARHGSDSGVDLDIICTSCHLVLTNQYTVQLANNVGDNESATADTIGLLLSPSGNNTPDTADVNENDYLCTACHGATPLGNVTHPVQPTMSADMSIIVGNNASAAGNGVTHISNNNGSSTGGINCESCHRPHNAFTRSGSLILENAEYTTYLNQQVLCNQCHSQ